MPVVAADLDAVRNYGLAFSLFLTTSLLGTVLAGGWGDARGPRGPVLTGLALFCPGLVVAGLADTFAVLLAGRIVSGVGAGSTVGLTLTGGALGWALVAWIQGRPTLGAPRHVLVTSGGVLVAASVLLLTPLVLDAVPPLAVLAIWTLAGLGMGRTTSSTSALLLDLSATGQEGRNSAALQIADALGSVTGIGAAGAAFAALHVQGSSDAGTFAGIWGGLAVVGVPSAAVGLRTRPTTLMRP